MFVKEDLDKYIQLCRKYNEIPMSVSSLSMMWKTHLAQLEMKEIISDPRSDIEPKHSPWRQPSPQHNNLLSVQEEVIKDMKSRDEFGRAKYGTPLQPNNGRDALQGRLEKLLNAIAYTKQL